MSQNVTEQVTNTPTRSPDIYLYDGNIVLIAQNVAFRVHKSQLARHSEVFCDMIACASSPEGSEVFDGCPVVRLSDTSDDISVLLKALYDLTLVDRRTARCIIAILRMSTKYIIERLRSPMMRVLSRTYPDKLSIWAGRPWGEHPHLVLALVNCDILLPAAYYQLCTYSMEEVFANHWPIPLPVFQTYCMGKDKIALKLDQFIDKHFGNGNQEQRCSDDMCRSVWNHLAVKAHGIRRGQLNRPNPLTAFKALAPGQLVSKMCQECGEKLMDAIKMEREAIWMSLPETFGLGSWEELRKNAQ